MLTAFQVVKLTWSLCRSGWRADRGRGGWRRQWLLTWLCAPASSALSHWSAVQLLMTDHRRIPSTQPVSSFCSKLWDSFVFLYPGGYVAAVSRWAYLAIAELPCMWAVTDSWQERGMSWVWLGTEQDLSSRQTFSFIIAAQCFWVIPDFLFQFPLKQ